MPSLFVGLNPTLGVSRREIPIGPRSLPLGMRTSGRAGDYLALICEGELTMISGLPLYKVIFPDTVTVRPA
jgi:hypothetical protein